MTSKRRLAYILAPSHSGSTLLAMLLASHPEVATAGELSLAGLDDPQTYRCSCGAPIGNCGFWDAIARRMAARGHLFDVRAAGTDVRSLRSRYVRQLLRPLHRGPVLEACRDLALAASPTWRKGYDVLRARNTALVACLCEETGAKVVVDSSKVGIRLKLLLRDDDLDVRVIRLIRDGRAVAVSYTDPCRFADARNPHLHAGGGGGTREGERLSMRGAAREWRRSYEEGEHIVRRLPRERWTEIRYEDLCRRTNQTLARLFDFLQVRHVARRSDFRAGARHVIGNGMRFDTTSEIRLDTRWIEAFTDGDRQRFEVVAGALNRRLGYLGEPAR